MAEWEFARSPDGIAHLVRYAGSCGLTEAETLAGTGLSAAALAAGAEVTAAQELRVLRTLMARVGPGAGGDLGRSYRLRTYGALGFAVLASRTVGDAITLALRYFDLSHAFVRPSVSLHGDRVRIELSPPRLPADLRAFVVDRDVEAVRVALGELMPGTRVERRGHRLTFAPEHLDRALPPAAQPDLELCAQLCQSLVDRRRARTGVAGDTRVLILQRLPDGAPMPAVAAALGLSERSLRRHLAAASTSYRALLDEVRASLAEALHERGLGLAEVAQRLGYSEAAALAHARSRWGRSWW